LVPRNGAGVNEESVLDEVRRMLVEVIGDDYVEASEVQLHTVFQGDLDVESIEFVALGEVLQERYSEVDFTDWLSTMDVDEIIALTVGDLVNHICQSYRQGG
jgi:acyl carrier protein